MKDVRDYLKEDNSYQYVPHDSQTPHGKSFLEKLVDRLRMPKPQNKERAAYEMGAKIYYEQGFIDGRSEHARNSGNVSNEDYDFIMKLLSLMGLSFSYFEGLPIIAREVAEKCGLDTKQFHTGLNLMKEGPNRLPKDMLNYLKDQVNEIFESERTKYRQSIME